MFGWLGPLLVATAFGVDPQPGTDVIILGSLDRARIDEGVEAHLSQLAQCGTHAFASLDGELVVKFVINRQGGVDSALLKSSTLQADYVETCVVQEFYQLRFPPPTGGGIVVVSYPLVWGGPLPVRGAPEPRPSVPLDRDGPAVVRADRTWTIGSLDRASVDAAIDGAAPGLARCLAVGVPAGEPAMGNLVARITFGDDGVALTATLDDDVPGEVAGCAIPHLGRIRAKGGPGVAFVALTLLP